MTDDDPVGPELYQCPVCEAVGLRERIEGEHDCQAFLERKHGR